MNKKKKITSTSKEFLIDILLKFKFIQSTRPIPTKALLFFFLADALLAPSWCLECTLSILLFKE